MRRGLLMKLTALPVGFNVLQRRWPTLLLRCSVIAAFGGRMLYGKLPLLEGQPPPIGLLDRQPLARRCGLLDQLQLEDTIVVLGLARRFVQFGG
jgi:hypothetical protein